MAKQITYQPLWECDICHSYYLTEEEAERCAQRKRDIPVQEGDYVKVVSEEYDGYRISHNYLGCGIVIAIYNIGHDDYAIWFSYVESGEFTTIKTKCTDSYDCLCYNLEKISKEDFHSALKSEKKKNDETITILKRESELLEKMIAQEV